LPEKIRIRLKDKSRPNLNLTPHEIGVGISQVLPVVVAAVGLKSPIILSIEQPELHIHPAVQVQLGDLFITQSSNKKFFLIETHSEHLLLRIMRRIRETAEEKAPNSAKILPHQVAIYYVESENGSTEVTQIGLDENGRFTDRWPRGFFEEREKEYFGDQEDLSDELGRLFGE
jgi:predicted ATPase